jgi:cell division septation protein DedD
MSRSLGAGLLCLLATVAAAQDAPPPAAPAPAVSADSVAIVVRRAQRLVNDGNGAEGRALLDSLLERTDPRSALEGEVLFWRATLAESWEVAQRDYLRLMLEHEGMPRAADAMLRLAQGEVTRGDRAAALRYLERLTREAPESAARAEAGLWQGRILIEQGARTEGCAVLRGTRGRVAIGAIELENQYDYLLRGCPADAAAAPSASAQPTAAPPITTAPATPPPTSLPPTAPAPAAPAPPAAAPGALVWSVQVAAFSTAAEATAFAADVRTLGFEARVDGAAAPFRVRFGRYATRAEAEAAMANYRAKTRADAFVTQVPRA